MHRITIFKPLFHPRCTRMAVSEALITIPDFSLQAHLLVLAQDC